VKYRSHTIQSCDSRGTAEDFRQAGLALPLKYKTWQSLFPQTIETIRFLLFLNGNIFSLSGNETKFFLPFVLLKIIIVLFR